MSEAVHYYNIEFRKHFYDFMNYKGIVSEITALSDFIVEDVEYFIIEVMDNGQKRYYALVVSNPNGVAFLKKYLPFEVFRIGDGYTYLFEITGNKFVDFVKKIIEHADSQAEEVPMRYDNGKFIIDNEEPHFIVSPSELAITSILFRELYVRFKFFKILALVNDRVIYSEKNEVIISKLMTASWLKPIEVEPTRFDVEIHISRDVDRETAELVKALVTEYEKKVKEIEKKYFNELMMKVGKLPDSGELTGIAHDKRLKVNVELYFDDKTYTVINALGKVFATNDIISLDHVDAMIYRIYSVLFWEIVDYATEKGLITNGLKLLINDMLINEGRDEEDEEEFEEEPVEEADSEQGIKGVIEKVISVFKH